MLGSSNPSPDPWPLGQYVAFAKRMQLVIFNVTTSGVVCTSFVAQAPGNVGASNLTHVQIIMLIDTAMETSTLSDLVRFGAMVIIAFIAFTCLLLRWTWPRTLETLQRFHIHFAKDADSIKLYLRAHSGLIGFCN